MYTDGRRRLANPGLANPSPPRPTRPDTPPLPTEPAGAVALAGFFMKEHHDTPIH